MVNRNYSYDRGSYSRSNYNQSPAPYRSGYSSGGSYGRQSQMQVKKHSGAKFITKEDGAIIVSAWNYSRSRGMITLYARPYKKSHRTESKSGKTWLNLFATIVYRKTGQISNIGVLLDVHGKKLYVKELNMVATSRGKGGYFGKHM